MALRTCPVAGCGRTMRTSETILLVSEHGAEYKRVCQRCARKATRILAAHLASVCKVCGDEEPTLGGRCVEAYAKRARGHVGKAVAARIRAAAEAYAHRPMAEHASAQLRAAYVNGMQQAADMAEAAGSLPAEGTEDDGRSR